MFIPNIGNQSILRPQTDKLGLQNIVGQINANLEVKAKSDTLEISREVLDYLKNQAEAKAEKGEAADGYTKYPPDMFTKEQWAENSIMEQRNGVETISDIVDHAKSKLEFTMSKISELENFLNGSTSHSDPHMTREIAEAHLYNYRESIETDYTAVIEQHLGTHRYFTEEYDELSGGIASQVTENKLSGITAQSLGLANIQGGASDIMKALEKASDILAEKAKEIEDAFYELTGKEDFPREVRSRSIFDGNSSLSFFESQMEKGYMIASANLQFDGQVLDVQLSSVEELQVYRGDLGKGLE